MTPENLQILKATYDSLLEITTNLYISGENASESEDYESSGLFFAQADKLYIIVENLDAIISEREEI